MPPPEPRKSLEVVPHPEASHWSIWRLLQGNKHGNRKKLTGPPLDNGTVPDSWPVSEFSTQRVLAVWGDGKYRVEWYGTDGERIPHGNTFEVAKPASKRDRARRLTPRADDEIDERDVLERLPASPRGELGLVEILTLLRGERESAQQREQAQADRDRQFFAQMQQQQTSLLTSLLQRPAAGGAVDAEILRREMRQTIREQMFELRRELAGNETEETEPDPSDPPADLNEAGERIGMKFLGELEQATPGLIQKVIVPQVLAWMKARGLQPPADVEAAIADAQANGHAHGR